MDEVYKASAKTSVLDGAAELATALKGLKKPQQKDMDIFSATIDADGTVEVKADESATKTE